jgi:hypothetical protein
MIAQLVAAGRDKDVLNKLSDCDLKAIAATNTQDEPKGDGWDKAVEYRQKYEALMAETENARNEEQRERKELLDDLLFNASALPWTEGEIKAMDIVQLRKVHKSTFPARRDYSGRGGPTTATNSPDLGWLQPIFEARKEAH